MADTTDAAGAQNERLDATGLSRWDAAAFRVFAVIAVLLGILALGWGVNNVISTAEGRFSVELPLVAPLDVPLPEVDADIDLLSTAVVTRGEISAGAQGTLIAGFILSALIAATVAGTIALCLWRLAQGRPFHRSLFGATLLAGGAMSIGGLVAAFLAGFGAMQVAFDVDPDGAVFVPGFTFDPTVTATGAVVLALAFVFRAGTRLQRETEGLV